MTEASHAPTFEAPTPEHLAELFPSYDIEGLVACGGMGAVFRAVQRALDRTVAIKILPKEFGADASFREAFQAEARAMAKLNHPNLIGVYDFGEVEGMPFIIMEYVAGGSLYEASYGRRIDPREVARIVAATCDGLAHAHEHGVLHRDIKPANILLDLQARPKIGDFGLARPIGSHEGEEETVFGTPHYTAPEVLNRPTAVDSRADIFSIGVVLHELLTGQKPADDPRLPSVICGCDIRFDAIVRSATNPMPEMRYANAGIMARELHQLEEALGRATKAVDLRSPTSLHRMPGPSNRAPGPVRRAPTAVARASYAGGKSGSKGLFTTILLLGAVVVIAWLILKTGIKVPQAPPQEPAVPTAEGGASKPAPETPGYGKRAAEQADRPKPRQQQGEESPFGSTTAPKSDP
ncbi:serine/threonine protein kinase [Luteolibacter ambystomatis]|uniref:Serine/threonine protein kinase n=1 Tax=Luteolibacter ambystomatis TaxID=2824561 RepID=A0A975IYU3_9BACT|nr:serine/threonine-protein kinase [Luteolibacter ambystomatis]QUE50582.1 serine/threonine protein kinase [Luteolibacter ambystomatis]